MALRLTALSPLLTAPTLSASELRFRRLFEAAHDGIALVDPDTRKILDVNPFLLNLLGYTHEEVVGRELFEIGLLRDEAANRAAFQELQAVGHIRYDDLPLQTRDGRTIAVEFVSNVYSEGNQQVIQCNIRDISARKKADALLKAAELKLARHAADLEAMVRTRTAELQLSNTQLEVFVFSIAHDLRAPLRAMQGFDELLVEEHSANLNQQGRDFANHINSSAQKMDRLLADLLAFSRISQQKIALGPVELATTVAGALAGCETELRASHANIENCPPWPAVLAHAATLRQVLVNLIGNAVKFVEGRVPRVRLHATERPGGVVRIWVEDNGIGIPAEFHDRIFQVFQRLHTTAYDGTGIGLAIVQNGMKRMGGRVGLESTPGEGTRFWIELAKAPAVVVAAAAPTLS